MGNARNLFCVCRRSSVALFFAFLLLPENGTCEELTDFTDLPTFTLRARWSEDWAVLNDPDRRNQSSWLPLKHITLGENETNFLSLGGEYRLAYESYDKADRGLTDIGYQNALQQRLAIHTDWRLNEEWRLFGQLGLATVNDREGGAGAVDETDPDIWQLFVDYRMAIAEHDRLVFRLGRQLIETANVFITAGEANNIRLVYNGGRVAWLQESSSPFEAFAAEYVDYADDAFAMSGTGEYFWGSRYSKPLHKSAMDLSFLYLGWQLDDRHFEQGGAGENDETRHTLMLWLNQPLRTSNQLSLDYYLAYQFGSYDDQPGGSNINAFAAFGEIKYAFLKEASTPIVGLKTSYFSGDSDPDDNQLNTFYNPVFGTPYFSYARDVMPFNLIHIQPNIGYRLNETLLVTLSNDLLWRASTNDAFYTGTNKIGVPATASESSYIGAQAQLAVNWKINRNIVTRMHVVHFWAGDVVADDDGQDQTYFHLGINFLF